MQVSGTVERVQALSKVPFALPPVDGPDLSSDVLHDAAKHGCVQGTLHGRRDDPHLLSEHGELRGVQGPGTGKNGFAHGQAPVKQCSDLIIRRGHVNGGPFLARH